MIVLQALFYLLPVLVIAAAQIWAVRHNQTFLLRGSSPKEKAYLIVAWVGLLVLWYGVLQGATTVEILSRL